MAQEHVSDFLVTFKELEKKVDHLLTQDLKLASEELQKLNRFVAQHASSLPGYELRKAQATVANFQLKIVDLGEASQPKPKFKFSRKAKELKKPDNCAVNEDQLDSKPKCKLVPSLSALENETIIFDSIKSLNKDVWFDNLQNCRVVIHGVPSTLHMTRLSNCKIIGGPIRTSIFLEDCGRSQFVLGCQQLRIHKSEACDFYLHVRSRAIIEDCSNCRFAPYNRIYDDKDGEFNESQLDVAENNWDQVDDFNWLSTNTPSPNWLIIPEEERITNWV